ncbi:patatin-like phospholipase family protein [Cryptosporidium muris RN66]|uniref:Patatin-like phospholipase family protein n=1 Tax=Cryptosporidium muris (strain RN66) TaxID=441375 RepID=B6ABY1_CRYMR|nr:patatin-like phospholipase family protein [Cryptosporidium muris RN66]EEA05334.1 patatin-like phospholipase family protein [Cryptosporidium muris RN66]|eukprot:XP_002139683.1 patatin-like phospholipase family protein [Cryptosporidium muris RN66]
MFGSFTIYWPLLSYLGHILINLSSALSSHNNFQSNYNRYHLEDARDNICYALVLSSGSNKGPWQAGVIRGIAQKYHDMNVTLRWDIVGGTSVGAFNGLVSQFYPPGNELEWTTELVILWKMTRQRDISSCKFPLKKNYSRWFLSLTRGMVNSRNPFRYLCDNSPARKRLRELFLHRRHRQRLFYTNTMRFTDRTAHVFTEQLELEDIIEAVVGSGTIPGIFPIKYLRNLGFHVDGGFVAAGDLETAIKRCIAVGKAKSPKDVVIDFISAQEPRELRKNTSLLDYDEQRDPSRLPFYSVLFESIGILSDMVSSTSVIRQMIAKYPDVTIRYLIQPNEEALMWIPRNMMDFSQWRKMHRAIEAGYNAGYNIIPMTNEVWGFILEPPKVFIHPPDSIDVTHILERYYKECDARKLSSGFEPIGLNDVTTFLLASNVERAIRVVFTEVTPYKNIFLLRDASVFATFMGPIFIVKRCADLMQYFAAARGVRYSNYGKYLTWIGDLCNKIGTKINEINSGWMNNFPILYKQEHKYPFEDLDTDNLNDCIISINNTCIYEFSGILDDTRDIGLDSITTDIRYLTHMLAHNESKGLGISANYFAQAKKTIYVLKKCVNSLQGNLQEILDQIDLSSTIKHTASSAERIFKQTYRILLSYLKGLQILNEDIERLHQSSESIGYYLRESGNIRNRALELLQNINSKENNGVFIANIKDVYDVLLIYKQYLQLHQNTQIRESENKRFFADTKHSQLLLTRIIYAVRSRLNHFKKILNDSQIKSLVLELIKCISIIEKISYSNNAGSKF